MTDILYKLFISRASPAIVEYLGKLIRNAAVSASAALALKGFDAGDNLTMIASGAIGLLAVALDFIRTHYAKP